MTQPRAQANLGRAHWRVAALTALPAAARPPPNVPMAALPGTIQVHGSCNSIPRNRPRVSAPGPTGSRPAAECASQSDAALVCATSTALGADTTC